MYIIPEPNYMELKKGYFAVSVFSRILISEGCPGEVWDYAGLLQSEAEAYCGMKPGVCPDTGKYGDADFLYELVPGGGEEAYELIIEENMIRLRAGCIAGLLYATQTLRQIVRQCGMCLPQAVIRDEPHIKSRGFYHDVTRGRVPTLESLKRLADTCSFYKLNQLQLYVEHSYLFSELDGLFGDRDPLTADEIRELDEYCRRLHIELVPSLSTFGHLYELLRTKEYAQLCETEIESPEFSLISRMEHYTIDVNNEKSIALTERLIKEYAALFSSDKFNICADETFDLGRGKNREQAEKEGVTELYTGYLKKLCNIIVSLGKTPMFWGDILQDHPEKINELPEETVCLYWNYEKDIREDRIQNIVKNGIKNICLCPGAQGWNHLINRYRDGYVNITRMAQAAVKYRIPALLVTDWGDYGHVNHPDFSVPGLIYGAAFSWSAKQISFEEINRRISVIEFGDRDGMFMQTVTELSDGEMVSWRELVEYKERGREIRQSDRASENNQRLQQAISRARQLAGSLPVSSRSRLYAWLLAAEGQKLWNLQQDKSLCQSSEYKHSLLKWYALYQRLWRSVSKESELARIGEVVHFFAE